MKANALNRVISLLYPLMWGLFLWLIAYQLQQEPAAMELRWPNITNWFEWRMLTLLGLSCCAGYGLAILYYFDSLDELVIPNLVIPGLWAVWGVVWLGALYMEQAIIWPDLPMWNVLSAVSLALSTLFLCFARGYRDE
ncbi:hypothetical protein I5P78_22335 [Serratia marcescens]|nr:hypothetical protein [Serratia marcescens]